jgi:glycosyltransferase involved in cell wall biosynthesis
MHGSPQIDPMHVVILSDWETSGGAAIAASRLAEGLSRCGVRVTRVVGIADGNGHVWSTITEPKWKLLTSKILRRVAMEGWLASLTSKWLDEILESLAPDVINVHNLHGATANAWSPNLLRVCAEYAPTVWTLHDMWSFSGRCAYSYDCRKFLNGCDASCPTPTETPALAPERIAGAWEQRRRLLRVCPHLVAVTPSRWLAQEAQAGLWAGHRIEVIPYGLPLDVYRPVERNSARKALGIDTSGAVLLVAAHKLTDRRKGMNLLMEALQHLSHRPLTLLMLGAGDLLVQTEGVHLHPLGYIKDEHTKALAYNAADVLVHPAPVDNLPNVVMESVACGVPVVSFAVGGLPDVVRPRKTGWLADAVSSVALARTLEAALNDLKYGGNLSGSCRGVAEAEFSDDLQAERYLALFSALLDTGLGASEKHDHGGQMRGSGAFSTSV